MALASQLLPYPLTARSIGISVTGRLLQLLLRFSRWRHHSKRLGIEIRYSRRRRLTSRSFQLLFRQGDVESIPSQGGRLRLQRVMLLVPFVSQVGKLYGVRIKSQFKANDRDVVSRLTCASKRSTPGIDSRALILITPPASTSPSTSMRSGSETLITVSTAWRDRGTNFSGAG